MYSQIIEDFVDNDCNPPGLRRESRSDEHNIIDSRTANQPLTSTGRNTLHIAPPRSLSPPPQRVSGKNLLYYYLRIPTQGYSLKRIPMLIDDVLCMISLNIFLSLLTYT